MFSAISNIFRPNNIKSKTNDPYTMPKITIGKPKNAYTPTPTTSTSGFKSGLSYGSAGGGGGGGGNTQPSQPQVQIAKPQPTTPAPKQQTMADYLKQSQDLFSKQQQYYNDSEARRLKLAQEQQGFDTQNAQQTYGNVENDLKEQIPQLQQGFDQYKNRSLEDIAYLEKAGERQKGQAADYYGSAQRKLAQNKRQTDAQREKQYAALGTIDSYGTGSFTQGNANADSDFNRLTNENLQAEATRMSEIDDMVELARRDTVRKVQDEDARLQAEIRKISTLLRDNSQAREAAIRQAYLKAEENKNNIFDQFEGLRLEADSQRNTFEQEMAKIQAETGGGDATKQQTVSLIDQLLGGDIGAITGAIRTGWIPGSQGALTKNQYDQLRGMLSLENRQKLQGSGAISDFEAKTLERAASALGQNLSEDQFRQVLMELRQVLGGGMQGMNNNDPLGLGL